MKTTLNGIWNIRTRKFISENGQVLIFWSIKDAKKRIEKEGRYAPDGEVLLRVMPIRITPYDNIQIMKAIYGEESYEK